MSSLAIGIVGLPNVGKSTLFNALTAKSVPAENFPFCTIDPSVGVVAVPDERLNHLSSLSESEKTIPAAVSFVDIAGLVKGASAGEGLGNKFLSNIREVDAIAEVVRMFDDSDIAHVSGTVDPMDDIEVINLELIMADLQTVTKRLSNIEKEIRSGDKDAVLEQEVLKKIEQVLTTGKLANSLELNEQEAGAIKQLNLLTMKPILYVLNKKSEGLNIDDDRYQRLMDFLQSSGVKWVEVDANVENEVKDVSEDDKQEFRREFGVLESGIDSLIRKGYELLDLITFFTTGVDETRAWTIRNGWAVPQAGTAIHNDFKDKFIRAEVISYEKLTEAGSYTTAREKGWTRTEGKEYIVRDGDVIEFKI
ncbi:MAG: redox-regulated ATPase YchF [Candidatus Pacebacteria bacterium]|jgi:GTP-binding protein YchF|nr:redox-regulated ATPase YchF [Parcubacteria group bacterium]MDP7159122.1 redox-regulated ATPase YchF [Candidatus Paceibacterota bacterium]MDP7368073.1 redox-regulated ATPase YchF [Candidatus Paceibacterota bacterium]MDP7466007.1 redox-regulated ATPase YchF [Candidatus Paceibacterota bacterium]MDP7648275.1 redox-regulated ATPase YchF [Candidatus Paceibacterota bacterium]|tara:strand:+ start:626 stop:1717 length:1092 start_codon:yes stop_codon:yes gene_type:complete